MKKYLSVLAVAAMATYATSALGQGIITFANNTGLVKQWTSNSDQTLISVPKGGGFVQLFWAAAGTAYTPWSASMSGSAWATQNPGWTLGSAVGFTTPAAGKFNGGNLTLTPLTPSVGIDYVIVGWTGTAANFDAAIAAGAQVNVSAKARSAVGDGAAVPPGAPVSLAGSFQGMTLQPVPEPSTLALAGLGAAALLIFRRRK